MRVHTGNQHRSQAKARADDFISLLLHRYPFEVRGLLLVQYLGYWRSELLVLHAGR